MTELLRPPSHRGPLIAAGGVLLTLGILLEEVRLSDQFGAGWHTLFCLVAAALLGAVAWQWAPEGGRPIASASVLFVASLILGLVGLINLANFLGADSDIDTGTLTWVLPLFGAAALTVAVRRLSAIAALLAALAFGGALLSAWDWIFDPGSVTPFRWLLLLLAVTFSLVSLVLRGGYPRHAEQLVNAAGLAILAIALAGLATAFFGIFDFTALGPPTILPGFWELIVLGSGCGLVAYGAVDRAPGPAYVGVANLAAFFAAVSFAAGDTLKWWPFTLLVLGAGALAAGLRPRRPLPPEPDAYSHRDLPLAARSDGETVVNVRHK